MNKKAFTLMELLLSVALLIIIVAVSLPFFINESNEILKESKRSAMLIAYQNTLLGSQLMLSIAYKNATKLVGDLEENQIGVSDKTLDFYCPIASRRFSLDKQNYTFGAKMNETGDGVVIYYSEGSTYSPENSKRVGLGDADLKTFWETLLAKEK